MYIDKFKKIVIKIGSSILVDEKGKPKSIDKIKEDMRLPDSKNPGESLQTTTVFPNILSPKVTRSFIFSLSFCGPITNSSNRI